VIRAMEHLLCEGKLRELGSFIAEKRRLQRDLIVVFQYFQEAYRKAGVGVFTRAGSDRTRGNPLS